MSYMKAYCFMSNISVSLYIVTSLPSGCCFPASIGEKASFRTLTPAFPSQTFLFPPSQFSNLSRCLLTLTSPTSPSSFWCTHSIIMSSTFYPSPTSSSSLPHARPPSSHLPQPPSLWVLNLTPTFTCSIIFHFLSVSPSSSPPSSPPFIHPSPASSKICCL